MKYLRLVAMITAVMWTLNGCSDKPVDLRYALPSSAEWQVVEQQHILFGHQSVGANLMAGVKALAAEQGVTISIAENAAVAEGVVIQHFPIGTNGDPESKLRAFQQIVNSGLAEKATVAEMKFCYLDFPDSMNPEELAQRYIEEMSELQTSYPHITFVATTSPLTTIQTGPKAWIKRILGKHPAGYVANFQRHRFNAVLRQRYGNSNTLFDLARIESLGGAVNFPYDDQQIEALAPQISNDGGHLNVEGQRLVAAAWIRYLAKLKSWDNENHP